MGFKKYILRGQEMARQLRAHGLQKDRSRFPAQDPSHCNSSFRGAHASVFSRFPHSLTCAPTQTQPIHIIKNNFKGNVKITNFKPINLF